MFLGCLMSCKNEAKKALTELTQALEEIENTQQSPLKEQKGAAKLSKTTLLTETELKKAFPNQLAAQFINSYGYNKLPKETDTFKVVNKERNVIKTYAEYYKKSDKSEIWFLYNNRFYISLSNDDNRIKMTSDELWDAFDNSEL